MPPARGRAAAASSVASTSAGGVLGGGGQARAGAGQGGEVRARHPELPGDLEVGDQPGDDQRERDRGGDLVRRPGPLALDRAGAAVDHEAEAPAAVAVGGEPDRQQHVLEGQPADVGLDPVDPLLVAADVGADVLLDHRVHHRLRLAVGLLDRDGVAFGAEAGEEARLVGRERRQVPGRERVGEGLGRLVEPSTSTSSKSARPARAPAASAPSPPAASGSGAGRSTITGHGWVSW